MDLDAAVADGEGGARCELVGHASNLSNPLPSWGSALAPSYRTRARATTSDGPMLPARSIAAIETGPPTLARVIVIVGLRTVSVRVPILTR